MRTPMEKVADSSESERFKSGAEKYARYLETFEGRLASILHSPTCRSFCRPGQGLCLLLTLDAVPAPLRYV
jgi:hypothetical protein